MSEPETGVNHNSEASSNSTFALVTRAAQDGAADAREAAARAWESTGLFMKRFVYTTCYTISYGVVFPSALLARTIPKNNAAVRGLIDGAQAAKQKVEALGAPALPPAEPHPTILLA
jgi:hypothetical protein